MDSVLEKLYEWMKMRAGEHLEFKEAKNGIPIDKLTQYCCALANEKGGRVVLGVSDRLPRLVVGTNACDNLEKTNLSDLDLNAIEQFRNRWQTKSGNRFLSSLTIEQLLADADLISERGVTFAPLILFAKLQSLGKYLPQAEVIFE